jgi:hypothetical protein
MWSYADHLAGIVNIIHTIPHHCCSGSNDLRIIGYAQQDAHEFFMSILDGVHTATSRRDMPGTTSSPPPLPIPYHTYIPGSSPSSSPSPPPLSSPTPIINNGHHYSNYNNNTMTTDTSSSSSTAYISHMNGANGTLPWMGTDLQTLYSRPTPPASAAPAPSPPPLPSSSSSTSTSSSSSQGRQCQCIIHRVYSGRLRSDVTCDRCRYISSTTDPMFDISLDLRRTSLGMLSAAPPHIISLSIISYHIRHPCQFLYTCMILIATDGRGPSLLDCLRRYTTPLSFNKSVHRNIICVVLYCVVFYVYTQIYHGGTIN